MDDAFCSIPEQILDAFWCIGISQAVFASHLPPFDLTNDLDKPVEFIRRQLRDLFGGIQLADALEDIDLASRIVLMGRSIFLHGIVDAEVEKLRNLEQRNHRLPTRNFI